MFETPGCVGDVFFVESAKQEAVAGALGLESFLLVEGRLAVVKQMFQGRKGAGHFFLLSNSCLQFVKLLLFGEDCMRV